MYTWPSFPFLQVASKQTLAIKHVFISNTVSDYVKLQSEVTEDVFKYLTYVSQIQD